MRNGTGKKNKRSASNEAVRHRARVRKRKMRLYKNEWFCSAICTVQMNSGAMSVISSVPLSWLHSLLCLLILLIQESCDDEVAGDPWLDTLNFWYAFVTLILYHHHHIQNTIIYFGHTCKIFTGNTTWHYNRNLYNSLSLTFILFLFLQTKKYIMMMNKMSGYNFHSLGNKMILVSFFVFLVK